MKTNKHNWSKRNAAVWTDATKFLENSIKSLKKGTHFVIVEKPEDDDEAVIEAPFISRVGKHGDYDEYAIISIEHTKKGEIVFHTQGKGEASDEEKDFVWNDFGYGDLNTDNLCDVCDLIETNLK